MKLKSETKQVIIFLKHKGDTLNSTVLQTCGNLGLNYDMVCRGLQLLVDKNIIQRPARGPKSSYQYPAEISMGDVVEAIEGINLEHTSAAVKAALNSIKL